MKQLIYDHKFIDYQNIDVYENLKDLIEDIDKMINEMKDNVSNIKVSLPNVYDGYYGDDAFQDAIPYDGQVMIEFNREETDEEESLRIQTEGRQKSLKKQKEKEKRLKKKKQELDLLAKLKAKYEK